MVLFLFNSCYYSQQEQLQYEEWYQIKQEDAKHMFDTVPDVNYNFGT
jgi:hypothetical protein